MNTPPRILAIGAHPDDCDIKAGGSAMLWGRSGCAVKFVSMTNGDAGHHEMHGEELARRRAEEARAAGEVAGIEYQVLDNRDGALRPGLETRWGLLRLIREFRPDLILTHRPNDYHPDHRYTSQLVQDCCYLVIVPSLCPEVPALEANPAAMYFSDTFRKPAPFAPDVAVDVDDVFARKIEMVHCHTSQIYEWLPWTRGLLDKVPEDQDGRRAMLENFLRERFGIGEETRAALGRWYGAEHAAQVMSAESFEACEYGAPLDEAAFRRLFPFLPS